MNPRGSTGFQELFELILVTLRIHACPAAGVTPYAQATGPDKVGEGLFLQREVGSIGKVVHERRTEEKVPAVDPAGPLLGLFGEFTVANTGEQTMTGGRIGIAAALGQ
ncbi:hypothetical protein AB7008_09465 [Bradyrhizobium sp. 521_C7_N1_3]|uniref:hypothetical protein n=1 Tax=Bradyrhizobium sp. 521_C7_N1_3 TaxID=3240368 RepID=UPI003F8A6392